MVLTPDGLIGPIIRSETSKTQGVGLVIRKRDGTAGKELLPGFGLGPFLGFGVLPAGEVGVVSAHLVGKHVNEVSHRLPQELALERANANHRRLEDVVQAHHA